MIELLNELVGDGESVTLKLTRAGDNVKVVVTPNLSGAEPKGLSEAGQAARAALATPLYYEGPADGFAGRFKERVERFAKERLPLRDAFDDLIADLREAGKSATNAAAAKKGGDKGKPEKKDDAKTAEPQPAATSESKSNAPAGSIFSQPGGDK